MEKLIIQFSEFLLKSWTFLNPNVIHFQYKDELLVINNKHKQYISIYYIFFKYKIFKCIY